MARKLIFVTLALLLSFLPIFASQSQGSALKLFVTFTGILSPEEARTAQQQVEAVRIAREAGPRALRELLGSLSGEARELALIEINDMERAASPAPGLVDASEAPRVGVNGVCAFSTIAEAIKTAPPGAVVRISAGIYQETIDLENKNLTLEGGYDATCTAAGTGTTQIDGSGSTGSAIDIHGGTVLLKNLEVSGGSSYGGGIDVLAWGVTQVTLDNTVVRQNNGSIGGGIFVGANTTVNISNGSLIADNSASTSGGGVAVYGTFNSAATASAIAGNHAVNGGGLAVLGQSSQLTLDGTKIINNHADNLGGGIFIGDGADITLNNAVSIGQTGSGGNTALDGGGVYIDSSAAKILGSISISNNSAANNGGGIFLAGSTLAVDGSAISVNTAIHSGGGIYASAGSVVVVQNRASIDHNTATGGDGGGIALDGGGTVNTHDAVLQYNTAAQRGGAIYSDGSVVTATNSSFQNNTAAASGGAIAAVGNASVTVQAVYPPVTGSCGTTSGQCSSLHHNQAAAGGAIYAESSALAILSTYLHHNSAIIGGGAIFQTGSTDGSYINSLIYANTTAQPGGAGIHLDAGIGEINQVTAADNTGGAGIWAGPGSYTVANSILWGNTSPGTSLSSATCSIDQFGMLGAVVDPQFISPGDYHLKLSSPAIDACSTGPARDLENIPRPAGLRFDMGAFEARQALFLPFVLR